MGGLCRLLGNPGAAAPAKAAPRFPRLASAHGLKRLPPPQPYLLGLAQEAEAEAAPPDLHLQRGAARHRHPAAVMPLEHGPAAARTWPLGRLLALSPDSPRLRPPAHLGGVAATARREPGPQELSGPAERASLRAGPGAGPPAEDAAAAGREEVLARPGCPLGTLCLNSQDL